METKSLGLFYIISFGPFSIYGLLTPSGREKKERKKEEGKRKVVGSPSSKVLCRLICCVSPGSSFVPKVKQQPRRHQLQQSAFLAVGFVNGFVGSFSLFLFVAVCSYKYTARSAAPICFTESWRRSNKKETKLLHFFFLLLLLPSFLLYFRRPFNLTPVYCAAPGGPSSKVISDIINHRRSSRVKVGAKLKGFARSL